MEADNKTSEAMMKKQKRRCYYEVLEVARDAPLPDIKSQYRKLALKYHPDKNPDEDSKEKFVEIQEAWKILSDVNERTWYDNHREAVLFNKHDMTTEEFELQTFGFNIKPYFSEACYKDFSDGPEGYFAVFRKLFELIKEEERKAYEYNRANRDQTEEEQGEYKKFMGFGDSTSKPEDVIKFYADWEVFDSFKTFAWADEYNLKEASCRDQRRQMQKENKKERLREKKKYIQTIKELVSRIKKKDPRMEQVNEFLKREAEFKQEQKKKKIEEERVKRQQLEEQRQKEIEEARRQIDAMKTEEEREKERQSMIEKPKIQERREKLTKHQCVQCKQIFKDFNKHFQHLQKTGHAKG